MVGILEDATKIGHSLLPQNLVIEKINQLQLEPPCNLNELILRAKEKYFSEVIKKDEMEDGNTYYQLKEVSEMGTFIKTKILARRKEKEI